MEEKEVLKVMKSSMISRGLAELLSKTNQVRHKKGMSMDTLMFIFIKTEIECCVEHLKYGNKRFLMWI